MYRMDMIAWARTVRTWVPKIVVFVEDDLDEDMGEFRNISQRFDSNNAE